jgi:hypothetical protein
MIGKQAISSYQKSVFMSLVYLGLYRVLVGKTEGKKR